MKNKNRFMRSVIGFVLSVFLLVISAILAEEKIIDYKDAIVLIGVSSALLALTIFFLAKTDYETYIYQCRKCRNTFKPTFKAYLFGPHTLTTRYLKCPKCEGKTWCKRIKPLV